jgi:hypothetical protein
MLGFDAVREIVQRQCVVCSVAVLPVLEKFRAKFLRPSGTFPKNFLLKNFSDGLTLSHAVNAPLPSGAPKISRNRHTPANALQPARYWNQGVTPGPCRWGRGFPNETRDETHDKRTANRATKIGALELVLRASASGGRTSAHFASNRLEPLAKVIALLACPQMPLQTSAQTGAFWRSPAALGEQLAHERRDHIRQRARAANALRLANDVHQVDAATNFFGLLAVLADRRHHGEPLMPRNTSSLLASV